MPYHLSLESLHLAKPCCHILGKIFLSIFQALQQRCQTQLWKSDISIYHDFKYKIKSILKLQYIKLFLNLIIVPSNTLILDHLILLKDNRNLAVDIAIPQEKVENFIKWSYILARQILIVWVCEKQYICCLCTCIWMCVCRNILFIYIMILS